MKATTSQIDHRTAMTQRATRSVTSPSIARARFLLVPAASVLSDKFAT